jgi:hypothetical protein
MGAVAPCFWSAVPKPCEQRGCSQLRVTPHLSAPGALKFLSSGGFTALMGSDPLSLPSTERITPTCHPPLPHHQGQSHPHTLEGERHRGLPVAS